MWDVRTITAADYTVELKIETEFYEKFVSTFGDQKPEGMPMAAHFRSWLKQNIESAILQLPNQDYDDTAPQEIKVAIIQFAYENAKVIKFLLQRGEAIKAQDWELVSKIDADINLYKKTHISKLMTPKSAFITFESEEGF